MISNGIDLFAIPYSHITPTDAGEYEFAPFSLYKFENDSWVKQYDIDHTSAELSGAMIGDVSISSTGDLFLHNTDQLYLIRDGEATKIIDYLQFYQDPSDTIPKG